MSVARNNQTTKTELFTEIFNGLEPFTNFGKKTPSQMFHWILDKNSPNSKKKKLVLFDIIDTKVK